jgi:hypothetical protein
MEMATSIVRKALRTSAAPFVAVAILSIVLIGLLLSSSVRAQDVVRTVDNIWRIDERGDGEIEFDFQFGAARWAQWKADYGDHPDLVLRNLKHQLAAAVIDDFRLDKDELHRHVSSRIKARALARYRGDGEFEIQVPKEMKLVSGSGNEWAFTNSMMENSQSGGIVSVAYHFKLPARVRNTHLVNENDVNYLMYSLKVTPSKPKYLLYLGLLFLVAALALGTLSLHSTPTKVAVVRPQKPARRSIRYGWRKSRSKESFRQRDGPD